MNANHSTTNQAHRQMVTSNEAGRRRRSARPMADGATVRGGRVVSHRRRLAVLGGAAVLLLSSCADGRGDADGQASPSASTSTSQSSTAPELETVEGLYDVGGHELYLRCTGSGSPTVVYMHGSILKAEVVAHQNANGIVSELASDYRTCVYDRRNVGRSDTVDAPQLPADAIGEMHTLLGEAEIAPPYVLLGASFGGMLAYLYANEYPDEVVGMLQLDAMFPDEFSLDHLFPPDERFEAFNKDDEQNSLERISHYKAIVAGQEFIGKEPRIPMTYLASETEGYEDNDFGIPEFNRQILKLQKAYVDRFSPGTYLRVDAPHFMEPVIAGEIAGAARDVIAKSR